jgi:hypothetical protein
MKQTTYLTLVAREQKETEWIKNNLPILFLIALPLLEHPVNLAGRADFGQARAAGCRTGSIHRSHDPWQDPVSRRY